MNQANKYSKILQQAYNQFILDVEGKKIPIPYRRNDPPNEHPARQGKSSPEIILDQLYEDANEQNFDLKDASVEEIRVFMRKNILGLDCSGFAYRMLNYLAVDLGLGNLQEACGFEHVGRTNVAKLTSDEFTIPVKNFSDIQSGDLIKLNSGEDILHVILVLEVKENVIIYAHSSGVTNPDGVHTARFTNIYECEDLKPFSFNISLGDGIRRLKLLK